MSQRRSRCWLPQKRNCTHCCRKNGKLSSGLSEELCSSSVYVAFATRNALDASRYWSASMNPQIWNACITWCIRWGRGNKGSKSWLHLLWCVHEDLDFRSHQEHVDGLILFVLRVVRRLVRSQTGAVLWQSPRRDARQETQTTGKAARARTAGMEFRRSCT